MRESSKQTLQLAALVALGLAAVHLAVGCATWTDSAQAIIVTGGRGLAATDAVVAPAYAEAASEALGEAETLDEYEQLMAPWNRVEEALRGSRAALEALERALAAYVAGSEGDLILAARHVLVGFLDVVEALEGLGLEVPSQLEEAVRLLQQFALDPFEEER